MRTGELLRISPGFENDGRLAKPGRGGGTPTHVPSGASTDNRSQKFLRMGALGPFCITRSPQSDFHTRS